MNSFDACSHHINGHLPYCLLCEIEVLRRELEKLKKINADLSDAVLDVYPPEDKDEPVDIRA